MTPPRILGIIPARLGSTRLPEKMLISLNGKPLIQRTYENAKKSNRLHDLYVATDDKRIFETVLTFGGKAIMTSPDCPTGTDRLAEAVGKDSYLASFGIIVNIQGDEPTMSPQTIDKVVTSLLETSDAEVSTACILINDPDLWKKNSVVKCVMDKWGYALYFSRAPIPLGKADKFSKQNSYFKHLGIYAYRKDFLLAYPNLGATPLQIAEDLEQLKILEHGFRIKVALVENDSQGIDVLDDLKKWENQICP
jgi:3-deoxy-manno-octulosonate cytidylyltransferase (CMP-KDO synthetase)